MITITSPKTILEKNLEAINSPLVNIENRTRANIQDLNQSFDEFWNLPDAELLEVLNFHGPVKIQAIFSAHESHGLGMLQLLTDRGIDAPEFKTLRPRELAIDDEGVFSIVPPEIEAPPELEAP